MIPERNKQNLLRGGLFGRHELIGEELPARPKSKFRRSVGTQIKEENQRAAKAAGKAVKAIVTKIKTKIKTKK